MEKISISLAILTSFWLLLSPGLMLAHVFRQKHLNKRYPTNNFQEPSIACVVTIYNNLGVAWPGIEGLLKQEYSNYHIYVVLDKVNFLPGRALIKDERITYIWPEETLDSKVKSIRAAYHHFNKDHDAVVVWDADNICAPSCLKELAGWYSKGFSVVQAKRESDQTASPYQIADNGRERFYNHLFRKVAFELGGSATLAGSGMLIDKKLYQDQLFGREMEHALGMGTVSGEDKMLQVYLAERNIRVAYAEKAIVWDDKVATAHQARRQRTRWMHAYFNQIPEAFYVMMKGLLLGRRQALLTGLFSLFPPLVVLLLLSGILFVYGLIAEPIIALLLLSSGIFFGFVFFLAIRRESLNVSNYHLLRAFLFFIPQQLLALMQIQKASKNFLPTQHSISTTLSKAIFKK